MYTCKKCKTKPEFPSISELRTHQWADHRAMYRNTLKAAKKGRPKKPRMKLIEAPPNGSEMTARELLAKLVDQRTFISDVVRLIESMVNS